MNQIKKSPINSLGYNFVPAAFIPKGKDEYYLRNRQNKNGIKYRQLSAYEIEVLVRNRNTSDDWNKILVSDAFNPELVQNCKFFGLVRIGKLESFYLEFNNLRRPVGMYNSTIISCDFGDNVVVDNVNYISHYITGSEVILVNVNEIAATDHAKFGNGILKEGETENIRIWLEVCNENGGRRIIPFDGMLPGDAWLWTQNRDDETLQQRYIEFTEKKFDQLRGYYGFIGDRTVIKNCRILKDVNVGSDAYLKGANKIKNVTINSSPDAKTQIGEGCELVNGIVDYGCRIFYGVKAVRFFLASHSQLKYGARLINSYLGDNSTISCCEVLNSLIFPFHEQHHNNSFLCASLVQGQSNIAAGATIGSNHNSRSPDGELLAGRGFWPGLCVSLKHNSKFASYTLLAKGDYPAELNIPVPFCLVSNDVANDRLLVMPAYWFQYNMYALARNSWKYNDRDKRTGKKQLIEFNFLAPDTINEMLLALTILEEAAGKAFYKKEGNHRGITPEEIILSGRRILNNHTEETEYLDITANEFENGGRRVQLVKTGQAYNIFRELIDLYITQQLLQFIRNNKLGTIKDLLHALPTHNSVTEWINAGGQLIPVTELEKLKQSIRSNKTRTWDEVHRFYDHQAEKYPLQVLHHALAIYKINYGNALQKDGAPAIAALLRQSLLTREWLLQGIYTSRAKDYQNEFRKMLYGSEKEMISVTGSLQDNSFIKQEKKALENYRKEINAILKKLKLASAGATAA